MKTVTDLFEEHLGVKEYNGIVRTMIEWYYNGSFAKVAWCAISMSYMLNKLGLLSKIGEKQENCYYLLKEFEKADKKGVGKLYMKDKIPKNYTVKRGTIVLILKSDPPMVYNSKKHVTSAYQDFKYTGSGYFNSLGGNQSDYIKLSQYPQKQIYAIYEPPYEEKPTTGHPTLKKGSTGEAVKELQRDLNFLGSTDSLKRELLADGIFKIRTEQSTKKFQTELGLKVDGIVGKITWGEIDKLIKKYKDAKIKVTTRLNCRKGPSKAKYDVIKVLPVGYTDTIEKVNLDRTWCKLKKAGGWVNMKYVDIT